MFVFFTTLDECCLLLIVTWPSLFIFFQLRMGAVFFLIVIWASPGFFFYNFGWVPFLSNSPLATQMWHGMDTRIPSNTHCPMHGIC